MVRPSARALDLLLHRDVGAVQLLRSSRAPRALHDGVRGQRWTCIHLREGLRDRGVVRFRRVRGGHPGRVDRRSLSGTVSQRVRRRGHNRLGPFQHGDPHRGDVFPWALPDRHRNRTPQAQHQHDGGRVVRQRRRAPRRRILNLLHGHQPRRVHRAVHRRDTRPESRLACRVRVRRRRHGGRTHSVRPGSAASYAGAAAARTNRTGRSACHLRRAVVAVHPR